MDTKVLLAIRIGLIALVIFLSYWLYSIIQEPIQYEKIKSDRYSLIQNRLEQIRDAQKAFRSEYGQFASDFQTLVAFVDTGQQTIIETKDSSFMRYNLVFQQDMNVDTIINKVLGYRPVGESLFGKNFNANSLEMIPSVEDEKFELASAKLNVNGIYVPVFEVSASNEKIFKDVYSKYKQFIKEDYSLKVGSLTEPTLSGNWK